VGYLNGSTGSTGMSFLLMSGALLLSVVLTLALKPGASDRVVSKTATPNPAPARS
jgi:hypothetical protein